MPRPTPVLDVSEDQRDQIEQWLGALGTPQQVALRGRIVLAAGLGKSEAAIARPDACQSQNRSSVARSFCRARTAKPLGDRAGPGPQGYLPTGTDQGGDRRHAAVQTQRDDSLELPTHGGQSGYQQVDGQQLVAKSQHQTAPHQNIQVVTGPQVSGKTHRRRRSLLESARPGDRALCRRKEPNSSIKPHSAWPAAEEGPLWHHDPRL